MSAGPWGNKLQASSSPRPVSLLPDRDPAESGLFHLRSMSKFWVRTRFIDDRHVKIAFKVVGHGSQVLFSLVNTNPGRHRTGVSGSCALVNGSHGITHKTGSQLGIEVFHGGRPNRTCCLTACARASCDPMGRFAMTSYCPVCRSAADGSCLALHSV